MDYEVINSVRPDSYYCTINGCDMISNFQQIITIPTSDKDSWPEHEVTSHQSAQDHQFIGIMLHGDGKERFKIL